MIRWTKEARAELTPRRGEVKRRELKYDPARLFADLREAWRVTEERFARGVEKGAPSESLEPLRIVREFYATATPDTPIDPGVQGVAIRATHGAGQANGVLTRDLARHWIALGGADVALRCLVAAASWKEGHPSATLGRLDYQSSWLFPAPPWSFSFGAFQLAADEVRHGILTTDDATYATVVATVGSLRDLPLSARAQLTSFVPTESAWARLDAEAIFEEETARGTGSDAIAQLKNLVSMLDDEALAKRVAQRMLDRRLYDFAIASFDIANALGDGAVPVLLAGLASMDASGIGGAEARRIARALALFDSDEVASALAPRLAQTKSVGPVAADYFEENPRLAARWLGASLLEKTKRAELAQALLARVARSHPEELRAGAKALPEPVGAAIEKLVQVSGAASSREEAPIDALPPVLRAPPWRTKARPTLPVLDGLVAPERADRMPDRPPPAAPRAATPARIAEIVTALTGAAATTEKDVGTKPWVQWADLPDEIALRLWNTTPPWARFGWSGDLDHMLDRFGAAALPGAILFAAHGLRLETLERLLPADSVKVAPLMARALGSGALRKKAAGWLSAHVEAAVFGLLPAALGPASPAKALAGAALRVVVERGERDAVLHHAASFGVEARAATEQLLAFDPRFDCPSSPPKLSGFADLDALPELVLADGRRAPRDGVRNLLEMLQFSPLDPPYSGIDEVRGAFDARSLDTWLRALVDAWIAAGAAPTSGWALRSWAHLGSSALAGELAAYIRRWPREKARPRAIAACEILGRMRSDVALMRLSELSRTAKNALIEARAAEVLAEVALARGLNQEELDDRLTPTLDFAKDGSTVLDFGPRQIVARVDDRLELELFENDTKLKSIPRVSKTDDPELAKAAVTRAKALKSDLEATRDVLVARFERAMVTSRRWPASAFRTFIGEHPLASRIARRLAWGTFSGDRLGRAFRIAEDGTLADADDAAFTLDDDDRVGVLHPLELDAPIKAKLTGLLADYRIMQPFEQIGRETFACPKIAPSEVYMPVAGRAIPSGALLGRLEGRGYRREMSEGMVTGLVKHYGGDEVTITIDPVIAFREKLPETLRMESVRSRRPLASLPAITYSEIVYDLGTLAR